MNDSHNFGLYLKNLRKEKKLSMRQLEQLTGVSNAYFSQIESGKRGIPSPEILKKIHEPLGVPYEELMEKAGHLSSEARSELHPETLNAMSSGALGELLTKAKEIFYNSVTDENGVLKKGNEAFIISLAKVYFPHLAAQDVLKGIYTPQILEMAFDRMTFEEKMHFLNSVILDFVNQDINIKEVFQKEHPIRTTTLKVPVMGHIAAGNPIFAYEHIEEWMELPNLWNLKDTDLLVLKVKGDSMIGSRIFEGDRVIVKLQPDVESGEIAVVNVNGDEATLKRVKKTENGQVILFPDNPKYEPIFIQNESARIIGKVIQVIFEP